MNGVEPHRQKGNDMVMAGSTEKTAKTGKIGASGVRGVVMGAMMDILRERLEAKDFEAADEVVGCVARITGMPVAKLKLIMAFGLLNHLRDIAEEGGEG